MPTPFTQLNDEPIQRDIPIASKAKGISAFGQVLGQVSNTLMQTGLQIEQEKSAALLLKATSSIEQIKMDAKLKLKLHPELAQKISEDTKLQLDNIKNHTALNKKHQLQLDSNVQSSALEIHAQAQLSDYETHRRQLQSSFYTEWPHVLQDLYTSVSDDKQFKQKIDITHQSIEKALLGRVITPEQASVLFKTLSHSLDSLQELHHLQQNPDTRSSQLNIALASPFAQGIDKSNTPISPATQHLQDYYHNDLTLRGIKSDLVQGNAINPLAWMKLTPDHLNEVTLFAQGIQKTKGLFNNGEHWPLLKQCMEALSNKNGLLTQTEKGERASLQHLIKGFNAGDYAQIIQATPQGQALLKDYAQNYNSVDPRAAYNDYISRSVQLGHAMQIDNHFIQPIPNDLKQQAQSTFIQGADPDSLLDVLNKHDPANKVYLAASLKKPLEQEVAYTVGMLQDSTEPAFLKQLIRANQTGQDFSKINIANVKDSNVSDKSLKNILVAKLHESNNDIFSYLSQSSDPSRALSIVQMAMNYSKYQGLIHHDLALKNINDYIQSFTDHFSKSYQISSGSNYCFDLKSLAITDYEAAILADHIRDKACEALGLHKSTLDKIPDKVDDAIKQMWQEGVQNLIEYFGGNRNALNITNTPDGLIIAVDQAGTVVYSQPFTDSLVTYAHRNQ
ncbi:MAG: hypothetical protein CFE62_006675 [Candidatus Aquirickettsiella gammari]|uniref:Uncharacterized protein n=1 Tax=Candidatus Aquirickettsiella gammari TaxID=2016198 RepID=A0A370CHX3_9COXI|nr:MAG: hypothetical protein CFE62_006675 [Candidatus Aquirickettsiella gammari]